MINYSAGDLLSMHSRCLPLIQTSTAGECVAPLSNTILLQCVKKKKKDVMDLKVLNHYLVFMESFFSVEASQQVTTSIA